MNINGIDFSSSLCKDCYREACCEAPCQEFCDQVNTYELNKSVNQLKSAKNSEKHVEDSIEDFLEWNVNDPEYREIINGERDVIEIICKGDLLEYMERKNKEFSDKNGLCRVCHEPLREFKEYEEINGSKQISEVYYGCPYGC